jgi:peptidoglycan/LPS O-acetylase OafA/YrhL
MEIAVLAKAYRPEVDGLRALAVSLVVVFHAFPNVLRGGFIGVDVFFVISGYLITRILVGEALSEGVSITNFYARRILRIMPALLLVLVTVYAAGLLLLLKPEIADLSLQVVASTLFSANVLFWLQAGYFDASSLTKPLLHLWSLGVEEQFYLLWPIVILACGRSKRSIFWAAVVMGAVSLACNVGIVGHHQSAAFFLPFSRLWELSAGALIVVCEQRIRVSAATAGRAQVGAVLLLVVAALTMSEGLSFPGWWAAVPVLGAVLVIALGGRGSLVDRSLSAKPIVWVGLISYPIYLWHWPVLSFAHILSGGSATFTVKCFGVAMSIVLAWLTYRFVERPARRRWHPDSAFAFLVPLVTLSMVATLGFVEARVGTAFDRPVLKARSGTSQAEISAIDISTARVGAGTEWLVRGCGASEADEKRIRDCYTDRREAPRFAIWGDSHANALMPGLLRESAEGARWAQFGAGGCPPMAGGIIRVYPGEPGYDIPTICKNANEAAAKVLSASTNIQGVLLATAARIVTPTIYAKGEGGTAYTDAIVDGLGAAAMALHEAGKDVYFLVDNPTFSNPKSCVARSVGLSSGSAVVCLKTLEQHRKESAAYLDVVNRFHAAHPYVTLIDSATVLCRQGACPIGRDGQFLYTDGDHLSDYGNGLLARLVIETVSKSGK